MNLRYCVYIIYIIYLNTLDKKCVHKRIKSNIIQDNETNDERGAPPVQS